MDPATGRDVDNKRPRRSTEAFSLQRNRTMLFLIAALRSALGGNRRQHGPLQSFRLDVGFLHIALAGFGGGTVRSVCHNRQRHRLQMLCRCSGSTTLQALIADRRYHERAA